MGTLAIRLATSPEDREEIHRLRYSIYAEELRIGEIEGVDHQRRRMADRVDEDAFLLGAWRGNELVGSMRLCWGGNGSLPDTLDEVFRTPDILRVVQPERVAVVDRFLVTPSERTTASGHLVLAALRLGIEHGVEVALCEAEPHLVTLYERIGFRPFRRVVSDHTMRRLLVPLVLVLTDRSHLDSVGSFVTRLLPASYPTEPPPELLHELFGTDGAAVPLGVLGDDELAALLVVDGITAEGGLFRDLSVGQARSALGDAHVIETRASDVVVGKDQPSSTLFAVLDGVFEIHRNGRLVDVAGRGDVVGELAMLLGVTRTADIVCASERGSLLAISDRSFERAISTDPRVGARLALNLARIVARKLDRVP